QALSGDIQRRMPNLAVETPKQNLIAVVFGFQLLEVAGLDALHDDRPARLVGDIGQPGYAVLALGHDRIVVLGLRPGQAHGTLFALDGDLIVQETFAGADGKVGQLEGELPFFGRNRDGGRFGRVQADVQPRPIDDLAHVLFAHHRARAEAAVFAGVALLVGIALDLDDAALGDLNGAVPDGAFGVFQSRTDVQADRLCRHGDGFAGGTGLLGGPLRRLFLGSLAAAEGDDHENDHRRSGSEGTQPTRTSHG